MRCRPLSFRSHDGKCHLRLCKQTAEQRPVQARRGDSQARSREHSPKQSDSGTFRDIAGVAALPRHLLGGEKSSGRRCHGKGWSEAETYQKGGDGVAGILAQLWRRHVL